MKIYLYRMFMVSLAGVSLFFLFYTNNTVAAIVDTKHNLSVSGPGTVKASIETEVCIFCHTPHNAIPDKPLWNRGDPGSNYTPYSSSTAIASPGQPNGTSLMCLSCHDGIIALGQVISRTSPITMSGSNYMPVGETRLGTDLSDDHPVSFVYSSGLAASNGELRDPGSLPAGIKLDSSNRLQCTSCHDAHENLFGNFLVMTNQGGALCNSCHNKSYWNQTVHGSSNAGWDGMQTDPWPFTAWTSVSDNACQNCHQPHTAGSGPLLLNYAAEENNCYSCHNGHVASQNIQSEFTKTYRHPIASTTGVHDPIEPAISSARHVECVDCHNPHAAQSGSGTVAGPLTGVRGVNSSGSEVNPATFEYEICYRCHADSLDVPTPLTPRVHAQANVRLEFSTTNPSFHPVAGPRNNPDVPSLIAGLNTSSTIKCSDCHANNNGQGAGGSGPDGPHGSIYPTILERRYETADRTNESSSNYALCYKCHSRSSILGDESFREHDRHIVRIKAPCNACHDPHGVSSTQGNSTNNSNLINFDISIVQGPMMGGGSPRFEDRGTFRGACYLRCHMNNHNPRTY